MSLGDEVVNILSNDVNDGTEQAVLTRNTGFGWSLGTTPIYTYTSLGTLWMGKPTTQFSFSKRINTRFGEGRNSPSGEISVYLAPVESTRLTELIESNKLGAETTYIEIVFREPEGQMSEARMEQIELRVRYLLDSLWRGRRNGGGVATSPIFTPQVDTSLTDIIMFNWFGLVNPIRATETTVRYLASYTRAVPR